MERTKITKEQCFEAIDSLRDLMAKRVNENRGSAFISLFEIYGALKYDLETIPLARRASEGTFGRIECSPADLEKMLMELAVTAVFAATCVAEDTCDWM